ncbi:MAG: branched-chain amino acid ABC transporter permease [Verrucomicrobia bacterium]|nr:branched-chain amino acid ABC transporter permease [Verrucomicrobiota bacterium]MBV9299476.1 branched-chain amino acid ABC transporter permease [Verrucomicrobiota bacterium]MBV9642763.1 branched-chain amino acid ABC transporter permease [Verrucomicrobiota bacterium]
MEQMLVNGVVLAVNYALIALGITLIFSIMNILNFAHGQMFMIGGFVVYYLYGIFRINYFVSLIAVVIVLGTIGWCFETFFFRRIRKIATREENSMLLAVGTALLLENLALSIFGEKQRGVPPVVTGVFRIGNAYLPAGRLLVMILALALVIGLLLLVQYTKWGRAMRALAQDREVTHLMGVNVDRVAAYGFGLGAALAGLAGGLLVTVFGVNSGVGNVYSIKAFIMIMIGGAGVVPGAILGAIVLGFVEAIGYQLLPGSITYLLIFIALIVFLIFRPQGLLGKPWG